MPRNLKITTASEDKKYTGDYWSNRNYSFGDGTSLVAGENLEIISTTQIMNVSEGKLNNEFDVEIKRGDDYVTSNYNIVFNYGTLEVLPLPISVTTESVTEKYNGKPHSNKEGVVTGIIDPYYTFKVIGERTNVGESENIYSLSIYK